VSPASSVNALRVRIYEKMNHSLARRSTLTATYLSIRDTGQTENKNDVIVATRLDHHVVSI